MAKAHSIDRLPKQFGAPKQLLLAIGLSLSGLSLILSVGVTAEETGSEAAAAYWSTNGWPLVQQYCIDCHNSDVAEAELDLSDLETLSAVGAGAGHMNRVLEMVRFGAMPPEDASVPSDVERKQLVTAIEKTLYAVSCDLRPRPGKVTARRLNRTEYNHSLRDLFGMDLHPGEAFPSDEVGGGFDNNGDMLSLSPMLVEKYMAAAETVSQQVVFDPETFPKIDEDRTGDRFAVAGENKVGSFFGRFLAPGSYVWAEYDLPSDGEYRIELRAGATQEPNKESDDSKKEDAKKDKMASAGIFDRFGKLLGVCDFKYFGGGGDSERDEIRVMLEAGKQQLFVMQLDENKSWKVGEVNFPDAEVLDSRHLQMQRKQLGQPLKPDGNIDEAKYSFMVRRLSVSGPNKAPSAWYPPSQKELVRRTPTRKGRDYVDVEEAAIDCLQPLMRRAFRGPVTKEDVVPYAGLVSEAIGRGESYYRGLQIAVSAVLVSPRFLFRIETPGEAFDASSAEQDVPLDPYQLVTRLSYFLWSSTPDSELLNLAEKGELAETVVEQQVTRMLADARSDSLASEFAAQWFGLRNLNGFEPDSDRFKGVDQELLVLMAEETKQVFMNVVRENRSIDELLSADYTFVNSRLAEHYGLKNIEGHEFRRVSLADQPRRGVLSHASVLTLTSNPTRTSPVKRGKWILENILGTPPPDPPPGVPELEETKTAGENATLREQLVLHRENAACASCHRVMDQLGFGLEEFDAVGRFRTKDGEQNVDASGELPGGRNFSGAVQLSQVLATSEGEAFVRTAAARLMTFALGRELSPTDRCTVDEIAERVNSSGGHFKDLVLEVIRSRQFQYYQWSGIES